MLKATYTFSFLGGGAGKECEDGERGGEAINRGTAIIRGNAVIKKATLGVPASGWRQMEIGRSLEVRHKLGSLSKDVF